MLCEYITCGKEHRRTPFDGVSCRKGCCVQSVCFVFALEAEHWCNLENFGTLWCSVSCLFMHIFIGGQVLSG